MDWGWYRCFSPQGTQFELPIELRIRNAQRCTKCFSEKHRIQPICSMYGIFTYIWVIFRVTVGKYSIHGAYGQSHRVISGPSLKQTPVKRGKRRCRIWLDVFFQLEIEISIEFEDFPSSCVCLTGKMPHLNDSHFKKDLTCLDPDALMFNCFRSWVYH